MHENYKPLDTIQETIRLWWLVVLLFVVGAAGGYLIHQFRAPVYEATAVLSLGIDYARTGMLTDIEEDHAVEIVGDVIDSTAVAEKTLAAAAGQGISITKTAFRENAFKERQNFRWLLRVRSEDPETAANLANAWVESSYAVLEEAYQHSLAAEGLLRYLDTLESCLEQAVVIETGSAICQVYGLDELQKELKNTTAEIRKEELAGLGLFSGMSFSIAQSAEVPASSVLYGRNLLMLAGGMIGAILSLVIIQLKIFPRIRPEK